MHQNTPYTLPSTIQKQREEYIKHYRNKDIIWKPPANKKRGRESIAQYWKNKKNNEIRIKNLPKSEIRSAKLSSNAKGASLFSI